MNATTVVATTSEHSSAEESQPVIGTTIFWILLTLCIASAWHPLGSSAGFPTKIRRHVRTLPLTALLDTALLYADLITYHNQNKQHQSFRYSAQRVAIRHLRANTAISASDDARGGFELLPRDGDEPITATTNWSLRTMILSIGTDMRPRFLSNALVVFVYTKMHAIHGAPFSLAIATLYFLSWVGNEAFLFVLFGTAWARNTQQLLALAENDEDEDTPLRQGPSPPPALKKRRLVPLSISLLALQVIAFIGVGIWIIASRAPPAPSPPTAPPSPPTPPLPPQKPDESPDTSSSWLEAIFSLAFRIVKFFAIPAIWWVEYPGEAISKFEFLQYIPPLRVAVLCVFVLLPTFYLAIPAMFVALAMVPALFFLVLGVLVFLFLGVFVVVMSINDGTISWRGCQRVLKAVPVWGGCQRVVLAVPVVVFRVVRTIRRAVFSASAVIWWARGGNMLLVAAMAVYYTCLWDAGGTSKAWWADHLG